MWNVKYGAQKSSACTHTHTHAQAEVVVDGRPQGVGRQPASQNEAQTNRHERFRGRPNRNIKHTESKKQRYTLGGVVHGPEAGNSLPAASFPSKTREGSVREQRLEQTMPPPWV